MLDKPQLQSMLNREHRGIGSPTSAATELGLNYYVGWGLAYINDATGVWPDRVPCLIDLWKRVRLNPPPADWKMDEGTPDDYSVEALRQFDQLYKTHWLNSYMNWAKGQGFL